jgi:acetyltransferase-like isoleucine patch superfamily enzyme
MTDAVVKRVAAPGGSMPSDDVFLWLGHYLTVANGLWMRWTYPFPRFGRGVSIHHSCDIRRNVASMTEIGDHVYVAPDTWLNVPQVVPGSAAAIVIANGCRIGRRCMISAKNSVRLEEDVMLGPAVLITDHSHEFANVEMPVHAQGLTDGGTVVIERNCWLGYGAAIVCTSGKLVVGRNSVVGANSVVTRSVPPFSVVAGNPAVVVKRFDTATDSWIAARDL